MFSIFPEEKITKSPTLKKWYIDKDRKKKEIDKAGLATYNCTSTDQLFEVINLND